MSYRPAYSYLSREGLRARVKEAVASLADCRACPRDCGVNRLEGKWAACKTGRYAIVGSYFPHFGEEDCLRGWNGSGTIFFTHCNLRCQFCFHPETPVTTERGVVRIRDLFDQAAETEREEIRLPETGTRVLTREGRWAQVAKAFRHEFDGELIRLKAFNCPPLLLTPNHRVFAVNTDDPDTALKIPAEDLTKEHRLVVPKGRPAGCPVVLDLSEILHSEDLVVRRARPRIAASELVTLFSQRWTSAALAEITGYAPAYLRKIRGQWSRGDWPRSRDAGVVSNPLVNESGSIRFKTEHRPGIPRTLELDEEMAWLLGLYCAEGHVTTSNRRPNSHTLVFSFGHKEIERARRVRDILERRFEVRPRLTRRRTTYTVELGKASLALLFARLCGKGARRKHVPPQLESAPTPVRRAFLEGVIAGDGCELDTHRVVNTVSRRFAVGLFELAISLGILPSYHRWTPASTTKIEDRTVRQSPLHYVKFPRIDPHTGERRTRWRQTEKYWMVPIHTTERIPYSGPVYNLEVDDPDHSYVASSLAVANCQNYDISQGVRPGPAAEGSTADEIAAMMLDLQERGCHNINFVTPEHVVPQVVEAIAAAVERGLTLPVIYNTSAYDALHSLELMEGLVDVYMPDFKFWSRERSRTYMKAEDYPEAARAAVVEMHRQVGDLVTGADGLAKRGLIVRHLVMPGMLDETRAILEWVATELGPGTYVNLMDQYYPAGNVDAEHFPEIDRKLRPAEFAEARRIAADLGLRRLDERDPHPLLRRRLRVLR